MLDKAALVCLSDFCGLTEFILDLVNDEMHDSCGQEDHEMEDDLEFRDGELLEFQSSGSSDNTISVEYGIETPAGYFDIEDIDGVLIQIKSQWFQFKDWKDDNEPKMFSADIKGKYSLFTEKKEHPMQHLTPAKVSSENKVVVTEEITV